MSTKGKTAPKRKAKVQEVFVPTHTQMGKYREKLGGNSSSIQTPIGQMIHWPWHMTRAIVPSDVAVKIVMFQYHDGWVVSYSVMSRILSAQDRVLLHEVLEAMKQNSTAMQVEHQKIWHQSLLQLKVHTRTLAATHAMD